MFNRTLIEHMETWTISYLLVMKWFKVPRSPLPLIIHEREEVCVLFSIYWTCTLGFISHHAMKLHPLIVCEPNFLLLWFAHAKEGWVVQTNPWNTLYVLYLPSVAARWTCASVAGRPPSTAGNLQPWPASCRQTTFDGWQPSSLADRPLMQNLTVCSFSRTELFWK